MRHKVSGRKLNRNTKQRKALFKSLIASLIEKGEIVTSQAKAKAIKRLVDKLVTRAKKSNLHSRRMIQAFFNKKQITNKLVDEIAPKLSGRISGYTKSTRLNRRRGDNTLMVKLKFTDNIAPTLKTKKKSKPQLKADQPLAGKAAKKAAPAQSQDQQAKPNLAQQALSKIKGGNQPQASGKITTQRTTSK